MAGISGQGTTFNLPNYVGELYGLSPEDTPFLSAIGGLTGGESTADARFGWGTFDLRDAGQNTRLEGADAPTAEERVRGSGYNVVQIHQEAVEVSYTKQAAVGQMGGNVPGGAANIGGGTNAVQDELGWQLEQRLKEIARDVEYSFIRGVFADPANNATARKTRGILAAIVTNVVAAPAAPDNLLSRDMIDSLLQTAWDNGGIRESATATLMVNSFQKRALSKAYLPNGGQNPADRNVGGVNLNTIETDFGRLNVMLNRYMPVDQVAVLSLDECAPVHLLIPGKGFLFTEELAKTGAAERRQIYGEIGLRYGNERAHAKITGLATAFA